eukprot:316498_1
MCFILSFCSILIAIYIPSTMTDTQKLTKEWVFQFDLQNVLNGESNSCTSRIPVIFKKLCVNWNDNDGFALKFQSSDNVNGDPIYDDMLWYYGDHKTAKNAEEIAKAKYMDLEDKELSEIAHNNDPSIILRRRLINRKTGQKTPAQKCYWYDDARACAHIDATNKHLMTVSVGVNEADNNNENYFGTEFNDYGDYQYVADYSDDDVDYNNYDQNELYALYNQQLQWVNYLQKLYYQNMLQQQQQQYAANAYNEYYDVDSYNKEEEGGNGIEAGAQPSRGTGKLYVLSAAGKRLFTPRDLYMFPKFTAEPPYPEARTNVLLLVYILSILQQDHTLGHEMATGRFKDEWAWHHVQCQLHTFLYLNPNPAVREKRNELEKALKAEQTAGELNFDFVQHSYLNARGYSIQRDASITTEGIVWISKTRYSAVRYADAQALPAGGGQDLARSQAQVINTYISPRYWKEQRPDSHTMGSHYHSNFGRTQTGLSIEGKALNKESGGLQYKDSYFHQSYPGEISEQQRVNKWYETWIKNIDHFDKTISVYKPDTGMQIAKIITKGSLFNLKPFGGVITEEHVAQSLSKVVEVIYKNIQMFDDYQLRIFAAKF